MANAKCKMKGMDDKPAKGFKPDFSLKHPYLTSAQAKLAEHYLTIKDSWEKKGI